MRKKKSLSSVCLMMSGSSVHRYVATAQGPTAVSHCCVVRVRREGSSVEAKFLVVAKGNSLETYANGRLCVGVTLNGDVSIMEAYRPGGEDRDVVMIITEHRRYVVLRLETDRRSAVRWTTKKAAVDLTEFRGCQQRLCEKYLAAIEPRLPLAAALLYDGLVHVLSLKETAATTTKLKTNTKRDASVLFVARLAVARALDLCFLSQGTEEVLLAVLHDDGSNRRHLTTYVLSLRSRRCKPGPFEIVDLDATSHALLPVSWANGSDDFAPVAFVVGEREVASFDKRAQRVKRVAIATACKFTAFAAADTPPTKYFLADDAGRAHVLFFAKAPPAQNPVVERMQRQQQQPQKIPKLQTLGTVFDDVPTSCLAYLGDRELFLGSTLTDSKVAKLASTDLESLRIFSPNLGPIVAACVAEPTDGTSRGVGQGRVVACCGAGKEGTLRVLRQGVDVAPILLKRDKKSILLPPRNKQLFFMKKVLRGLWCLPHNDSFLVVGTFANNTTQIFRGDDDPVDLDARTLHCALIGKHVLIVATSGIFKFHSGIELCASAKITVASSSASFLVVAGQGFLRAYDADIRLVGEEVLEEEPSCVALRQDGLLALSNWGQEEKVSFRFLKDLKTNKGSDLSLGSMIRSLAFLKKRYLLMGLGDGLLLVYEVVSSLNNIVTASPRRRVSLGSIPVKLYSSESVVFAASDRAATVRADEGPEIAAAHLYDRSSADAHDWSSCVLAVAPESLLHEFEEKTEDHAKDEDCGFMSSEALAGANTHKNKREALLVATPEKGLRLCGVERQRGVRASGVTLGEQPRCVCHDSSSQLFCVGTAADLKTATKGGCLRFLKDAEPYHEVRALELDDFEEPMICVTFKGLKLTSDDLNLQDDDQQQDPGLKKQRLFPSFPTTTNMTDDDDEPTTLKDDDNNNNRAAVEGFLAALRVPKKDEAFSRDDDALTRVIVVGTAIPAIDDFEPSGGRLLIFEGSTLRASTDLPGAVYDVALIGNDKIAVAINHAVLVFDASLETKLAFYEGFVVALKLAVIDDNDNWTRSTNKNKAGVSIGTPKTNTDRYLAVGDLMRSVTVLKFSEVFSEKASEKKQYRLEEVARDFNANWTTALAVANDEIFLGEASSNLLALKRPKKGQRDLETVACVHLGDVPSCFSEGSLATEALAGTEHLKPILFGCVSGKLGCLLPIPSHRRDALDQLQRKILDHTTFLGDLDYDDFKAFKTESKVDDATSFLDGDLLETFLDMPSAKQQTIVDHLNRGAGAQEANDESMSDDDDDDDDDDHDKRRKNKRTTFSVDALIVELGDLRQQH